MKKFLDAYAEDKAIINASVGIFNRYIFRGYELSSHSVVIQPALNVSYKGFSTTLLKRFLSSKVSSSLKPFF